MALVTAGNFFPTVHANEGSWPTGSRQWVVKITAKQNMLKARRPKNTGYGLVEPFTKLQASQGNRPYYSNNGLIELIP